MATAKQLPSGSWRVRIKDMDDPQNPWKSFTAATAEEAEFMAAQYKYLKKTQPKPEFKRLGDCMEEYIDNRSNILSPSTIALYRIIRRTAFPTLTKTPIGKITPPMIQAAVNKYSEGRSYKTVSNAVGFLKVVMGEYAPETTVKVNMPQRERKEIVIPTTEQVKHIMEEAKGTALYLPVLFAALLGMRRSEVCALTWDDIDLKNKTIRIDEALVMDEYNTLVRKKTKTTNSKRTLTLPDQILEALPAKGERIIRLTPKSITTQFGLLTKRLGYEFTYHGLRHYNASLMLQLNVPNKYAMERMGHATDTMLKRVYQHTFADESRAISDRIQSFIDERIGNEET